MASGIPPRDQDEPTSPSPEVSPPGPHASPEDASAAGAAKTAGSSAGAWATGAPAVATSGKTAIRPREVSDAGPAGNGDEPAGAGKKPTGTKKGAVQFLRELPVLLLVAFLLALLIKTFLVQAFYIPSESMEPTLHIGDRVLVNKVVYHLHSPRRGDVIVFSDPHAAPVHRSPPRAFVHWITEGFGAPTSSDKDFIKRVIGLPGDTVEIDDQGKVFVNGTALREPYLSPIRDDRAYGPTQVPAGTLFVMGDNRTNSNDSRFGLGFIPLNKVVGRAVVIIWPPSRVRWLHGL
jgi:signal peptidase I